MEGRREVGEGEEESKGKYIIGEWEGGFIFYFKKHPVVVIVSTDSCSCNLRAR